MGQFARTLSSCLWDLLFHDEGQDIVEYALVVALIAFGAIIGLHYLSSGINNAFSYINIFG